MKKNRLLENYYKLSREQRIQWKKYLCVLGTAFLLFLLLINLLYSCGREEPGAPETEEALPQHIPVVRELKNVWITEAEAHLPLQFRLRSAAALYALCKKVFPDFDSH